MSKLKKEIADTKSEIKDCIVKHTQPQLLPEDIFDQTAGVENPYAFYSE